MVCASAQHVPAFAMLVRHDVPAPTLDRQGANIVGADVVVRVVSLFQGMLAVDVGMVNHQQRAAGCHQAEEPLLDCGSRRAQERGGEERILECRSAIEVRDLVGLPEGTDVVAYCHVGSRSRYATEVLSGAGYRARNYVGSWHEWSRAVSG